MFIGNNISSSSGRTLSSGPRALASFPPQPELTCRPTNTRGRRAEQKADGGAEKYIPSCREHLTFTQRMVARNTNAARAVDMQRINILKGQERKQSPSLISQLNVVPSYCAQTLKRVSAIQETAGKIDPNTGPDVIKSMTELVYMLSVPAF